MRIITELEKKYYKLLIGETFHCYDITLNELLIIMNAEFNINTLSLQKSGRHMICLSVKWIERNIQTPISHIDLSK